MKILITGGSGFIGKHLVSSLIDYDLLLIGRDGTHFSNHNFLKVDLCDPDTDFSFLSGVDVIIHCAGLTPKRSIHSSRYHDVNFCATANFAKQATRNGVTRFIYISTAKVNGEYSLKDQPFNIFSALEPKSDYAKSKLKAEEALINISKNYGMEFVIIRPPVVYGKNVKGLFFALIKVINLKVPLLLLKYNNNRSFVYVENLTDLIKNCITHNNAVNHIFYVSDNSDISTNQLVNLLRLHTGNNNIIFYLPKIANIFLKFLSKDSSLANIYSNFEIDITETNKCLDWLPSYNSAEAIKKLYGK